MYTVSADESDNKLRARPSYWAAPIARKSYVIHEYISASVCMSTTGLLQRVCNA